MRFVSCHCVMGVDGIHIDAVELSLVVDSLLISRPQQVAIGDGDVDSRPSRLMVRSRLAEFDLWRRAVAAISSVWLREDFHWRAAAVRVFAPALRGLSTPAAARRETRH